MNPTAPEEAKTTGSTPPPPTLTASLDTGNEAKVAASSATVTEKTTMPPPSTTLGTAGTAAVTAGTAAATAFFTTETAVPATPSPAAAVVAPALGVRVFGREDGRTVHESAGVYKSIKQKVAEKWSARLLDVASPHKDTASKTMLPVTGQNWCCAAPCVGFDLQAADDGEAGGSGSGDKVGDRTPSYLVNGDTVRLSSLATNANLDINTFVFVGKCFAAESS